MSANTKFAKQSILGKPPSSSRPKPYVGIFRINPFKASRVENFVPNKHVKTSVRTKPIIVSQPHDEYVRQYVNGMKSRKKNQSANVSKSENQKKHKAQFAHFTVHGPLWETCPLLPQSGQSSSILFSLTSPSGINLSHILPLRKLLSLVVVVKFPLVLSLTFSKSADFLSIQISVLVPEKLVVPCHIGTFYFSNFHNSDSRLLYLVLEQYLWLSGLKVDVIPGRVLVTPGSVVVTPGSVITTGSILVTPGSVITTGSILVTPGSVITTGSILVTPGSVITTGSILVTPGSVITTGSILVTPGSYSLFSKSDPTIMTY
ncbi:hypothetical protein Tco_1376511 [Tanacetum coccineum]